MAKKKILTKKTLDKIATLDPQEQKYIANRLSGMSRREAGLEAGFSESAAEHATKKIEKSDVTATLRAIMEDTVPLELIAKRIREGMDASDTEIVVTSRKGAKKTEFIERDRVNFAERRQATQLAVKVRGVKGFSSESEDEGGKQTIIIHLDA